MKTGERFSRRKTRVVHVGNVPIGGGHPISVQSMTTTHTRQVRETLDQIRRLAAAGCEIVRVAVPAPPDAKALPEIVAGSPLPVVADIHFNTALARHALEAGVANRVTAACLARGLIVYPGNGTADGRRGDHLLLAPPFTVTEEELDEYLGLLAEGIGAVEKELGI